MNAPTRDVRDGARKRRTPKKDHRLADLALDAARAKYLRALQRAEILRLELAGAARVFATADLDSEQAMTAHLTATLIDQAIRRVESTPVRITSRVAA